MAPKYNKLNGMLILVDILFIYLGCTGSSWQLMEASCGEQVSFLAQGHRPRIAVACLIAGHRPRIAVACLAAGHRL